jgi:chemotaxis protein methyltransferase CheR
MDPNARPEDLVLERIERALRQRYGLAFRGSRRADLALAVAATSGALGAEIGILAERAEGNDEGVLERLVAEVAARDSLFFRDEGHFEFARRLIHARAAAGQRTVVWSAGCAGGEDAYSLVITAMEALGSRAPEMVTVLASEMNSQLLGKAQAAIYRPWSMRGMSSERLTRWFEAIGRHFRVVEDVRRVVTWLELNLADPAGRAPADVNLVLCRHVLADVAPERLSHATAHLTGALATDGWLVTAAADPPMSSGALVANRAPGFVAYRKRREPWRDALSAVAASVVPTSDHPGDDSVGEASADPGALLSRATQALERDDVERAISESARAIALDPALAAAHFVFAVACERAGRVETALAATRTSRELLADATPDALLVDQSDEDSAAGRLSQLSSELEERLVQRASGPGSRQA